MRKMGELCRDSRPVPPESVALRGGPSGDRVVVGNGRGVEEGGSRRSTASAVQCVPELIHRFFKALELEPAILS